MGAGTAAQDVQRRARPTPRPRPPVPSVSWPGPWVGTAARGYHEALAAARAARDTPTIETRPPETAALTRSQGPARRARPPPAPPAAGRVRRDVRGRPRRGPDRRGEGSRRGGRPLSPVGRRRRPDRGSARRPTGDAPSNPARAADRRTAARARGRTRFGRSLTVLDSRACGPSRTTCAGSSSFSGSAGRYPPGRSRRASGKPGLCSRPTTSVSPC